MTDADQSDVGPADDTVRRDHGRWWRRVAKATLITLIAVVALLAAALVLLDTSPGRRMLAEQIQSLEFENGMRIGIGRIEGTIYGTMVIKDLSLRDPEGEFLFAPRVELDWRPRALARYHLDITSVVADRMTLRRLPTFLETPPSDDPLLPDYDIDVGRLEVHRFVIEAPVTGERRLARLSGRAHIADRRAQVHFAGETLAVAGGGAGDRILIDLDAVPERNQLDMKAKMEAPSDGVLAAMAGLDIPLAVDISGSGTWRQWNGALIAGSGTNSLARLQLRARDGTFSVNGPARLSPLVEGMAARLLDPVAQLDVSARLEDRAATLAGSIASTAYRLETDGVVDLANNRFEDLNLRVALYQPSAVAENLSGSGLRAELTLNGDFGTPRIQYALAAARIVMNDMGLEQFRASGAARIDADHILIPVAATARRITGLDTVAGGTLANVRLDGDLAIDGARVLSDNMRIRSDRIDGTAILLADLDKGLYTGAIDGRINNYRIESVGIFNVQTDVELRARQPEGFALEGRVLARSTQLLNATLEDYLGGNFVAASNVSYGGDGTIRLANLRLEAPDIRIVGGRGSYSPDGRITLVADATSDRYGRLEIRLAGTLSDPDARITAERPDLGIGLADLEARITGARDGFRFELTGSTDYGPLTADVTLQTGRMTQLQINSAELSGVGFSGSLRQLPQGPFAGTLRADGNGLGGIIRLDAEGRYQRAEFSLRSTGTVFTGPAELAIGSAIVDGTAVLYDRPHIVADAQLADTRYGQFDINAARLQIDYRNGRGQARALIEGRSTVPFRLSANARLEPEMWRVALAGRVRGIQLRTERPALIRPGNGRYDLLPASIAVGGGRMRVSGSYGDATRLQALLEGVDLAVVNAFAPGLGIGGEASGSLEFVQASAGASPQTRARLKLDDFTRTTAFAVSQPVDVTLAGELLGNSGDLRAAIRARGGVLGRLQVTLRPQSGRPGSWSDRMLGGGIRYNGPADTLLSFAGPTDQRLVGTIAVAADFSCRLSNPCLNGIVRGSNLTYENLTYGTRLTNLDVSARFEGNQLTIANLSAAANGGTLRAAGQVGLSAAAGYPMDLTVSLDRAQLARSDLITTSATGELRLTKTAGQTALLSGTLRLPETRYRIVREGAAQVPQLSGVRFLPPRGRQRITGDEAAEVTAGLFENVRLDIEVVAPDELYVSGMGLESEWEADFRVFGTTEQPRLQGSFTLQRGTLGFAGRSFRLTRGRIRFTGGQTIDPDLDIQAAEDVEELTVSVSVAGGASDPAIAFSSVPGLPQDEILSRILFGSSIANLGALQAVQLAASLNSLRGSGSGLNPLGRLRSATGIDRLRIVGPDQRTGQGTAIAAGQHISDDVYVELITDARGFTATQLEVSLTPWLSVLSQAGGSGGNSVNLQIKKDY